jgi:biotin synthase
LFLAELNPHMVGIGPFISHHETPFANEKSGTLELTLFMLAILRLMFPSLLIPSTTALGTIDPFGREQGILSGANVVMPNLSPLDVREKYMIYDNKIATGLESSEYLHMLKEQMRKIGYEVVVARGDYKKQ